MKYVMLYDANDQLLPYMLLYVNEEGMILKWASWESSIHKACSQDMRGPIDPQPLGGLIRYAPIAEAATIEELQLVLMLKS